MVLVKDILKDRKMPLKTMFKRMVSYVKPEYKSFIIGLLMLLVNVGLSVVLPIFVGKLTDALKPQIGNPALNVLIWISVGYLLISLVNQVFLYFETIILTKAGQRIIYNLRMEVFSHVESMSQNQFNDMAVGSLVTRVCNYTSSISEFFTSTLVKIIKNILMVISVFILMFFYSWQLSLIMIGVCILLFVISWIFSHYVHKQFSNERRYLSDLNTFLNESLSGMKIVQIFNQEKKFDKRFLDKNNNYRKTRYKIVSAFAIYRPLVSFIYVGSVALIFFFGIRLSLVAGSIVTYYLCLDRFFMPIQELADELNHITRAFTAAERLFNLIDVDPEVMDQKDALEIKEFKGKIEFKHVWFAYEKENWILKDVSFIVNPKETAAFVGATGAGKTTILGLIVRNFEVQKGQILIDDIDIQNIKLTSLRKAVGQMLQDVFLFTGSIKDNITLFDDKYTNEQIIDACDYVNATQVINKENEGLESQVIERGENFSTGQRQLLSFARTVLAKPQIIILDEATANIDTETEVKIQESLEKMKNIGTMLIVAHRLSTIQHSDKIFVLSKGEIIESGSHQQLLKKKGHYFKLYQLQFEER